MNWIKVTPFLLFAICIDGFQFLISLALSVVATLPGTTGGCAVGAYFAGEVGCAVLGVLGSFPVINGALAMVTEPIGMALGFAISVCISFTLGTMLILFLQLFGLLDKKAAVLTYMGEVLPGFSVLPAWTALVLRCLYTNNKGVLTAGLVSSVLTVGSTLVLPNNKVGNAVRQGTLVGSSGFRREMPRKEFEELRPSSPQRNLPMQDVRFNPTPYAKTS